MRVKREKKMEFLFIGCLCLVGLKRLRLRRQRWRWLRSRRIRFFPHARAHTLSHSVPVCVLCTVYENASYDVSVSTRFMFIMQMFRMFANLTTWHCSMYCVCTAWGSLTRSLSFDERQFSSFVCVWCVFVLWPNVPHVVPADHFACINVCALHVHNFFAANSK